MKTTKLFFASAMLMAAFITAGATRTMEAATLNASSTFKDVNIYQAQAYLEQFHTVNWIEPISGTSNYLAGIENCGTSTIWVSGGQCIGHTDQTGNCSGSIKTGHDLMSNTD